MCPPFRISETAVQIALKFGTWLETHYLGVRVNGGVQLHARTPFPYVGDDRTDLTEIGCLIMGQIVMRFIGILSGAHCTYAPLLHISVTAGRFVMKFSMYVFRHALTLHITQSGEYLHERNCSCASL